MKKILILLIKGYRRYISPYKKYLAVIFLMSPDTIGCRFEPTCSVYAMQAIEKYGAIKGSFIATKRILRCNPFCKCGYDPLK